jgi:hypothetical protein
MADEADLTADRMEKEEELRRRLVRKPELPPCGVCYFCGEDVGSDKKFCNAECAEDFEFEQKMKQRQGRSYG